MNDGQPEKHELNVGANLQHARTDTQGPEMLGPEMLNEAQWQAVLYVLGELPAAAADDFERRLADDVEAQSALAAAVGLLEDVKRLEVDAVVAGSPQSLLASSERDAVAVADSGQSTGWLTREARAIRWLAACSAAVLFLSAGWWLGSLGQRGLFQVGQVGSHTQSPSTNGELTGSLSQRNSLRQNGSRQDSASLQNPQNPQNELAQDEVAQSPAETLERSVPAEFPLGVGGNELDEADSEQVAEIWSVGFLAGAEEAIEDGSEALDPGTDWQQTSEADWDGGSEWMLEAVREVGLSEDLDSPAASGSGKMDAPPLDDGHESRGFKPGAMDSQRMDMGGAEEGQRWDWSKQNQRQVRRLADRTTT